MQEFSYRAFDQNGEQIDGILKAYSEEEAGNILLGRGYIPSELKRRKAVDASLNELQEYLSLERVGAKDLIIFTKQFKTMVRAGVPMLETLPILKRQTENNKLKRIITGVAADIEGGASIPEAFRKYSSVFSPLYCSVLHAGERGGALAEALERLISILEHEYKVKSDIRAAMFYPAIVLGALCVAFFLLLVYVVPKFVRLFESRNLDLPLPTQICIQLYRLVSDYGFILLPGFIIVVFSLMIWFKTETGGYFLDAFLIRLPILGGVIKKSAMSRFASIFSILYSSGVPVLDAIRIMSGTLNSRVISYEFNNIITEIEKGSSISKPLQESSYFTPMVINMISVGERTENLAQMLDEVSKHYDSEVEYAMRGITEALTPILTIGMAIVVGFFALAIFLPLWDIQTFTQ